MAVVLLDRFLCSVERVIRSQNLKVFLFNDDKNGVYQINYVYLCFKLINIQQKELQNTMFHAMHVPITSCCCWCCMLLLVVYSAQVRRSPKKCLVYFYKDYFQIVQNQDQVFAMQNTAKLAVNTEVWTKNPTFFYFAYRKLHVGL